MIYKNTALILFLFATIFFGAFQASAQNATANDSWLDRPLSSWNRTGRNFPVLPRPSAASNDAAMLRRCSDQIHQPSNAAEAAVTRLGWKLYGASQHYGLTQIFTALSGFDGMCRPAGYQAFVYWEGRYAGTLAPAPMDSRADGSLTNFYLTSPTTVSAEFNRYAPSDALCCPSKTSAVFYNLRRDDIPDLTPANVTTSAICRTDAQSNNESGDATNSPFVRRWILTEIGGQKSSADKPFIEFDEKEKRVSGDAGCNRFFGGFEMTGANLKFTNVGSTMMACADTNANRLETRFLRLLNDVTRFDVPADTLRLYAGNRQILVFRASGDAADNQTASVTGTVSYLQRIALAPNAVVKVQLLDVSRAGARAPVIAEQTINAENRQVPFSFELKYDPNEINSRNRYAVRAQIYENGRLRFTSTRVYPVITNGNPDKVAIIVNLIQ